MPVTIHLPNGTTISREDALKSESDIIAKHSQFRSLLQLYMRVWEQRGAAGAVVAMHVGESPERIEIPHHSTWKRGGFNIVVPMFVKNKDGDGIAKKEVPGQVLEEVLLRIPMPGRLGEEQHPGSVADKLRCETASYIWMQRHCPDVRIPHLYGFGFPGPNGGHHCVASWLRQPVPSDYLPVPPPAVFKPQPLAETGYMVLENLSEAEFGKQIHYTVPYDRPLHDLYAQEPTKTRNLCRGLARTMLALARVPQPRIGAFRFCLEDGTICLDGRPVTCDFAIIEGEGSSRTMELDTTYTNADRYVSDLIRVHEAAFRSRPNAALDQDDAVYQMAVMAIMRSVAHCFVGPGVGEGDDCGRPYLLQLSDSNPSNMLFDEDWNMTAIFDLEWLFAAPVAQLHTPLWLTWQTCDEIAQNGYDSYCASRKVYMDVLREEEGKQTGTGKTPLSDAMDASWASERTWFYLALTSVTGMTQIFESRLRHLFWPEKTQEDTGADTEADTEANTDANTDANDLPYDMLYQMWHTDAQAVVAQKVRDREQQKAAIERLFSGEEML